MGVHEKSCDYHSVNRHCRQCCRMPSRSKRSEDLIRFHTGAALAAAYAHVFEGNFQEVFLILIAT